MLPRLTLMREDVGYINPLQYGTLLNAATILATSVAQAGEECTIVLTPGLWLIDQDVILPENQSLYRSRGAEVVILTGVTMTVPRLIDAAGVILSGAEVWKSGAGTLNVGTFTVATLPVNAIRGSVVTVTDEVRGPWMASGSEWFPIGGQVYRPELFEGVDLAARIGQIMAAMGAEGGVIDARRYQGGNVLNAITLTKPCTLILGRGNFTTSDTAWIRVTNPGGPVRIQGRHGRYTTAFYADATQSGIVVENDQPIEVSHVHFDVSETKTAGVGISVNGYSAGTSCPAPTIKNCTFIGQWQGIRLISAVGGHIKDNDFLNARSAEIFIENIDEPDAGDHEISCNTFNSSLGNLGIAIFQQSSGGLRLVNNKILFHSIGFVCDVAGITNDLFISLNSIENQWSHGIQLKRTSGSEVIAHVIITNNEIANQRVVGVGIDAGNFLSNYEINDNTFLVWPGTSGISVGGGADGIILGNTFLGDGSTVGITIGAGAADLDVGLNHYNVGTPFSNVSASAIVQPSIRAGYAVSSFSIGPLASAALPLAVPGVSLAHGDEVMLFSQPDMPAGVILTSSRVTANDQVTAYLYNTTGGTIVSPASTFRYFWIDVMP